MKLLKKFDEFELFEKLFFSNDLSDIITQMYKEDKVAQFLYLLSYRNQDLYDDDEDLNYIDLSNEINKLSFVLKRRKAEDHDLIFNQNSMPTRIGKVINKIYTSVKPYFKVEAEIEITIKKTDEGLRITTPITETDNKLKFMMFSLPDLGDWSSISLKNQSKPGKFKFNVIGIYGPEFIELNETKTYEGKLLAEDCDYLCDRNWYTANISNIEKEQEFLADCAEASELLKLYVNKNIKVRLQLESNIEITSQDIEEFVNKTTAYLKVNKAGGSAKLEMVKGEDIRFWYDEKNYQSKRGDLGNSCMSNSKCQRFFDIYVKNSDRVSLIVLKNNEGKLLGRALLWLLDNSRYFLDRCYCILDADAIIFYNWAKEKGFLYKKRGNIYDSLDDSKQNNLMMTVSIDYCSFSSYPYLDTFRFLDMEDGTLTNKKIEQKSYRVLSETNGGYDEEFLYYDDDGDDDH